MHERWLSDYKNDPKNYKDGVVKEGALTAKPKAIPGFPFEYPSEFENERRSGQLRRGDWGGDKGRGGREHLRGRIGGIQAAEVDDVVAGKRCRQRH